MTRIRRAALAALLLSALPAANAAEVSLQLQINTSRDFQRQTMSYDCAAESPLTVTYLNAAPNFLAVVPVADEAEDLIFVSVMSASGARYASGKWVWWTKGAEASLYDTTLGEDADPILTCSEATDTP